MVVAPGPRFRPDDDEQGTMTLRITATLLLSLALLACGRVAYAQFIVPGPPPGAYALPPDVIPDDDDDDDDVVAAPGIQSQPLPPPAGGTASRAFPPAQPPEFNPGVPNPRYQNPNDPQAGPPPGAPIELTAPRLLPPQGMPQAAAAPSAAVPIAPVAVGPASGGLRPPANIEDTTGTIPGTSPATTQGIATSGRAPAAAPGDAIAALPPEDQPEDATHIKELPSHLRRQEVEYWTKEPAGTIIIDTPNTYLYYVLGEGKAMRYGIGVGREGFTWAGREKITKVAEWPDWFPPSEMIERQPYLPRFMAGGESNPLGARALYLGKTLFRIHGTNQPSTIGSFVSSGCVRLVNADIEDLYQRVKVGTRVVVLPGYPPAQPTAAATPRPAPATAANPAPQAR